MYDSGKAKYVCVGKEVGEEGTPHLQGYVQFKNSVAFSTVKSMLSRAHIEVAKGTTEQNVAYCTKDGEFIELGNKPMDQKTKGDRGREYWESQLMLAKEGRFAEIDPKLQLTHFKTLVAIKQYYAKDLGNEYRPDCKNYWLYGPTGSGKSRSVRKAFPDVYYKMANKWWENYSGQEVVLIEDLDKTHHVLGHHLKLWADCYPFRGEIKNNSTMARPKNIVVTSNYHPSEIWQDPGMLEPILRRFCMVKFPLALGMEFEPGRWPVEEGVRSPPASLPMDDRIDEYFEDEGACRICAMTSGHLRTCELAPKVASEFGTKRKKPMN
jgi:hypothetical protein